MQWCCDHVSAESKVVDIGTGNGHLLTGDSHVQIDSAFPELQSGFGPALISVGIAIYLHPPQSCMRRGFII